MSKIIIGIDPDSKAHGVSVYFDGKLEQLKCLTLLDLMHLFGELKHKNPVIHIEDVCANNAAFGKKGVANFKAAANINRSVGKCQQAAIEVERMAAYYGMEVVKHKISKAWKKDRNLFESITGWKLQSNEDTRSAAYFGWLGATATRPKKD